MTIKNIFFVMFACVISFSKPVFSSTAEPEAITEETLEAIDWDGLPDASLEYQELWQQALAAVGVRDCVIPVKQGAPYLYTSGFWCGNFRFGINQKLLKKSTPGIADFIFYLTAMHVKHGAISVSINMPVALADKILIMRNTLGAFHYLLKNRKNDAVDAWSNRLNNMVRAKTQSSLFSEASTNEALLRYSLQFILAHREGKNPDYNFFAKRYMTELLTGNKQFRCIQICRKNKFSGHYEDIVTNLEDDDYVIDHSQPGQPIEPPAGTTVDEIADELSQKIFGS
jgi:hypothetical protein